MIEFEKLFEPIEPPPGPDTVLAETHLDLIRKLETLASLIKSMAVMADAAPWADSSFDYLDEATARALKEAQDALLRFRNSRDCSGSA